MIEKRQGFKFVASFEPGPPLKLDMDGDKVKVSRGGRLVAFLTKLGIVRVHTDEK